MRVFLGRFARGGGYGAGAILGLGFTVLGCGGLQREHVARVVVPAAASAQVVEGVPAVATAAEPARPPCEVLNELSERGRKSFPNQAPRFADQPCLLGKGGGYSLAITYGGEATAAESYGGGVVGSLVLLNVDARGQLARSTDLGYEDSALSATFWSLFGIADYDGDGKEELLVSSGAWEFEGQGSSSASIWQVAGEHIEPYEPARKLNAVDFRDLDADGLPDLVTRTPFSGDINGCGPDGTTIEIGPSWVAHAVKGGFGFDAISRAEVRRTCPAPPKAIVPRSPQGIDNDELRKRVACAVVWGTPSASIVRELENSCPKPSTPPDECAYEGVQPVCVNPPQLARWAAVKPPFVLP